MDWVASTAAISWGCRQLCRVWRKRHGSSVTKRGSSPYGRFRKASTVWE
jgi:hypothetical protein